MSDVTFVPQRGYSNFRGQLVGTQGRNFYKEETKDGKTYRRLNFGIKTSPKQTIFVELFGMKQDKVYAYNRTEKKTIDVKWDKRHDLPVGYVAIGTTVDDKNNSLCDFDAIEAIKNQFNEGDSIFVNCENQYSVYNDNLQVRHSIKSIYHTSDVIDFEAEDFVEQSDFTQELTIIGVDVDKELRKMFINAYVIENKGKTKPPVLQLAQFVISLDNKNQKMVKTMSKQKFGTTMKVQGIVKNTVVTSNVPEEDNEWGTQPQAIESHVREMEITMVNASTVEVKKYKDSDVNEFLAQQNEEDAAKKMFNGEDNKSKNDNKEENADDDIFDLDKFLDD